MSAGPLHVGNYLAAMRTNVGTLCRTIGHAEAVALELAAIAQDVPTMTALDRVAKLIEDARHEAARLLERLP